VREKQRLFDRLFSQEKRDREVEAALQESDADALHFDTEEDERAFQAYK
jgi:hypothetical protein